MRSCTLRSVGPATTEPSRTAASALLSPCRRSSGRPARSPWSGASRAAIKSTTDSASNRRATNASVWTERRSSHCASSTINSTGSCSANPARSCSTARPTRKRSGGGPTPRPNAVARASRCGAGRDGTRSRKGRQICCSPAYGSSISDSTPTTRTRSKPSARVATTSRRADLPIPASPRTSNTPL